MLPRLFKLNLGMDEEKRIIRRYFTGISRECFLPKFRMILNVSEFMGGIAPPYNALESSMRVDPGSVIEKRRMPQGVQVLRDPKWWNRKELNAWIAHVLNGQKPRADTTRSFQWYNVPVPKAKAPITAHAFQKNAHPESTLQYSPNELLYARKVQLNAEDFDTNDELVASWNGLPLARTLQVYTVYRTPLGLHLLEIHSSHKEMCNLIRSVAQMEQFGPIHVSPLRSA